MLRLSKKLDKTINNKGMALITVIVCIGFVAALVSILLMTTLVNFKMKSVNSKSKDAFYSAEQVLDEVNIGLQRIVSDSMSEAYLDIMNNYATLDSKTKTEMLTTKYYENLWEALEVPGSSHSLYDVTYFENNFLKNSTKWHENTVYGEDSEGGGYGAILAALDDSGEPSKTGKMITYLNDGLVLKDFRVYYKDEMGFVSIIQTDIRLSYPKFDFAASSELPNLPYYCMIADGGATVTTTNTVDLQGNVYANNLKFTGPTTSGSTTKVVTGDSDLMIVKYNLDLNNSVFNIPNEGEEATGTDTVLWANNLILNSSKASFDGKIQVQNDLNIKGDTSLAKLSGEYVGFGTGAMPEKSSSILVNGINTTIDMSKLKRITLAGRAYVGTNMAKYDTTTADVTPVVAPTVPDIKNNDIMMGESLAVKANQLLYLVPATAIGVDETTGHTTKFSKNPLTSTLYKELRSQVKTNSQDTEHHILEVSDEIEIPTIGNTLAPYVEYATNGGLPKAEKVFVRTNSGESLVYYYMAFENEQKANQYFSDYYGKNKDSVDKYMSFYLNEVKIPDTSNMVTFKTVGNFISGKYDDEKGFKKNAANSSTLVQGAGSLVNDMMEYDNKFNNLCLKLLSSSSKGVSTTCPRADKYEEDTKANQVVFQNIVACSIEDNRLKTYIDNVPAPAAPSPGEASVPYEYENVKFIKDGMNKVTLSVGGLDRAIICNDETSTILIDESSKESGTTASSVKLIITKGNVKVSNVDFDGLILCDGTLEVSGSDNKLHANPAEVTKCFKYGYVDPSTLDVMTVAYVLKEGDEYVYSSLDPKGNTSNLALGGMISYENWKKE